MMGATAGRREVASKRTTTTSTTRGGGRQGHRQVIVAPSSFDVTRAVANVSVAVIAAGNDGSVHCPPEVR